MKPPWASACQSHVGGRKGLFGMGPSPHGSQNRGITSWSSLLPLPVTPSPLSWLKPELVASGHFPLLKGPRAISLAWIWAFLSAILGLKLGSLLSTSARSLCLSLHSPGLGLRPCLSLRSALTWSRGGGLEKCCPSETEQSAASRSGAQALGPDCWCGHPGQVTSSPHDAAQVI